MIGCRSSVGSRSCSPFSWPRALALSALAVALAACGPPPEEVEEPGIEPGIEPGVDDNMVPGDPQEGPYLQAPGGAYLDLQCEGKHRRFPIESVTYKGGRYVRAGSVERFQHLDTSCNRVEIDTNVHYRSGTHVFEGDVKIGRVSGQSVVQIFNAAASGPIMMIKAYSSGGGTLRKLSGSHTLATGITGKWVRIRIVHNMSADTLTIYVNGDRKWSGDGGKGGGGFNLKYGNYGTGAPTDVEWRNANW